MRRFVVALFVCVTLAAFATVAVPQSAISIPPQVTRQSTAARTARTPQPGELVLDTNLSALFAGDGSTAGGVGAGIPYGGSGSSLTGLTVAQVAGAAATANNLSDLANANTARVNLGLGTIATQSSAAYAATANNLSDLANANTARVNLGLGTAATMSSTAFANSITLTTPNVLYSTPVNWTNTAGAFSATLSLNTQTANQVFSGPTSGGAATPAFRSLVAADIPSLTTYASAISLTTDGVIHATPVNFSNSAGSFAGTLSLNTQAKNVGLFGPISGANAAPTFRGINAADIPSTAAVPFGSFITGNCYVLPIPYGTGTISAGTGQFRCFPVFVENAVTLTSIGGEISTGSSDTGRTVTDGATTNNSPNFTSSSSGFLSTDVGRLITTTNFPAGTSIISVQSGTAATASANATATSTSQTFVYSAQRLRFGIYSDDGTGALTDSTTGGPVSGFGKPGTLLLDCGTIDATSNTVQLISINQGLSGKSWYWFGWALQAGSNLATLRQAVGQYPPLQRMPITISGATPAAAAVAFGYQFGASAALPGTAGGPFTINSNHIPRIIIKL